MKKAIYKVTISEFLSSLNSLGINIWIEDEQLRYRAPNGVITSAIKQELKERKTEIFSFLKKAITAKELANNPILSIERNQELPLSFSQQRMWFLNQLDSQDSSYNESFQFQIFGALNVAALEQSINEIIRRHEALRTIFTTVDGLAVQRIVPTLAINISVVDLQGLEEAEIQQLVTKEVQQPFDLGISPLLRATLLRQEVESHLFILTMHHIIMDGWSIKIFLQELSDIYQAFSTGSPTQLPELTIQYGDFVVWQRKWFTEEVQQKQLDYWKQQLADAPPLLELPTDYPRPSVQTISSAVQEWKLNSNLTAQIKALSQQSGTTLFVTLLASFSLLLHRYSGQDDISIGSPFANRNRTEIQPLIGFFINTLVLRTQIKDNPSFQELLTNAHSVFLDAYAHQDVPFEQVVEALQPERSPSYNPLFQVWFNLLNLGDMQLELSGLSVEPLSRPQAASKFDLNLYVTEQKQNIQLELVYNTDLFNADTIARMLSHYQSLLESIVANPEQKISTLPLLTETEHDYLKNCGNIVHPSNPFIEFHKQDIEQSIPARFQEQVRKYPQNIAVHTKNYNWTYSELNSRANQVAQAILQQSTFAEARVALLFEHDAPMIAGILGALKAGKTYVPLDPSYPLERVVSILEDSQANTVITNNNNLAYAQELARGVISVININIDKINFTSTSHPVTPEISPNTIAYILYTSGSTGQPKGVIQNHRNVLHFIRNYTNNLHINEQDGLTLLSSYSFDAALMDIFAAVLNGATLYPINIKEEGLTHLFEVLQQQKITIYHSTPTLYRHFVSTLSKDEKLPQIRLVVLGGEEVIKTDVDLYKKHFSDECIFVNGLGPTESTVTLQYFINQQTEITRNTVPVGYPIEETEILLLNEAGDKTDIYGEIAIRSPYVALGYWHQPDLTQVSFLPDPEFSSRRIYRTGDLGRLRRDGSIEFLGRKDFQVKIRGFRIELGEIEAAIAQHPSVRETVVIAIADIPGEKYLVAYVVATEIVTSDELRHILKQKLPDYMVPTSFVFLDSLPLTPNRKIDRRALPKSELHQQILDKYVAPRTPVEEMLAQIWAQVLKVEQVGIHNNFFELGGHSLLATQLVSRIRNIFRVELPLRSLFAAATVAELGHLIEQLQQQNLELIAPPILPRAKNTELPLSYAQQRLWFLDQLEPNSAFYNIPITLHLQGNLNLAALKQGLQEIINRHEALRTNFITVDGKASQIINLETPWTLSVVDLQHLSLTEQEIASQQLVQQQAIQPFDLASETLVRATLVVLSETEQILLVCMHHIVSDAWSMGIFVQELTALYNAYSQGQASSLAPLLIQYADFALWQRNWLQGDVLQTQLNYWQQQLKDAPALLSLPSDRPRPAVQTFAGAHQKFALSIELTQKLTKLSQEQGCTLFMTLLAAYDTLLYRYTGQSDILVGSPIANRNRSEIEGLIGVFVNTLVMRTDLSGNPSFSELLTRIREMAMDAYSHQDLPFEMLVEVLQPERNLSHTPLFQVMFVLQNAPRSKVELAGLTVSAAKVQSATAKFDLTLTMENTATGLVGVWEYNTDLFDSSTIARMTGHFVTMLEAIVANPSEQIDQLPLLTEVEQRQLLVEWNDTQIDYPQDLCIHQLFESQCLSTPDAIAVIFENQQLTYSQLNNRANQLAHYLQSLGVRADMLVGICVERSLEMLVGLLGILKAGGAYLPLDPEYPQERLSFILEDAQVSILLTQQQLVESVPKHQARVVYLDSDWEKIAQNSESNPSDTATPDNLAYVIYTSGSTGKPKGVLVNHSNVTRLFAATEPWYHFDEQDVWTLFHSYAFDFSVWEIWGALLYGGRLVVVPYLVTRSPESFYNLLCQEQVTILNQTPSAFRQLIQAEQSITNIDDLNLRLIIFGGEALELSSLQPWFERHGDQQPQLVNMYGITETTVHVTYRPLSKGDLNNTVSVIGRPIPDLQVYLLDEHLQPVPIGVPGEMHIGGAGVTRGYLNRPELTAQRFIYTCFSDFGLGNRSEDLESSQTIESENQSNNPKSKIQNPKLNRLYKTGDLARYLPNGELEYLGRIDQQVKIRGFRIELGEIEALLAQHPDVRESVVVVREDEPSDKRLVAYVTLKIEQSLQVGELRRFLKSKLPEYMLPNAFVILEAIPLTSNGKVDRRALPAPELHSQLTNKFIAPRTPIEEMLALIWAQVLKVEQVGIYDNFFELGGHSLLATQLLSRIRKVFKIELPLRSLFIAATVAELVQEIGQLQQQDLEFTSPPILPRAKNAELPLSFAQTRLWFLDQFEPNSAFYNIPIALHLVGTLNQVALEQSLEEIIHRHEALRTNFITVDGQPTQIIQARREQGTVSVVNLQHLSTSEQEIASQQLLQQQAIQPFDLARQALVRATLVVLSETEHILLVCMHHVVSDGWSMDVFVQELAALYNAYSQGQPSPLAPLPIQYADFAIWQRNWLQGDVLQTQLSYWQQQLADAPALLSLRTDRPRPAVQTFAGAHQKFALSIELTQKLTKLSQEQGVTLFMTLLGAYDTLLYRYTEQSDILVGTPIANRNNSEIEGLIGFFVNTLVLRTDLSGNPSFSELLTRVRETALGAYSHQDLPFEMLVEALQPERDLSYTPLFQVMFVLENAPISQLELTGLNVSPLKLESTTAKFDLTLAMENTATGLVGVWQYNTDLFDAGTIARMAGHFVTMLEAIVANPSEQIAQLPLLTAVERHQLLIEWNDTQVDYHQELCIHKLFEQQVKLRPDAIAVIFENQQLTYQQLNERANQLAHYLQEKGVNPEVLVGIFVERSIEMIVGLLGILKAGGAYVPLDPNYPTERLAYMLSDTGVSILLTQQSLVEFLPENQAEVLSLDSDWQVIANYSQQNALSQVKPENLAYVIYTSGSTGKPKGVMNLHQSICNNLLRTSDDYPLTASDRILQISPFSFDPSVFEIFWSLTSGTTLVVVKPEGNKDTTYLSNLIAQHQVTQVVFVPSLLQAFLQEPNLENCRCLKRVFCGGEALSYELTQRFFEQFDSELHNLYGPTEAAVDATSWQCTPQSNYQVIPIGRPIANTQIYILDPYLQPVPIGVAGELHIGGVPLARGYLNQAELTQEKFIPNPFGGSREAEEQKIFPVPSPRLYKTGDLARYLPDGNIEYLGRIGNQVKVRGFRIELGEIETVLSQHSEVNTVVVIAREDITGDKRLVAYIVPQKEVTPTVSVLRQYLKAKLPEYMVPNAFVILEALPLTPNGKVDHRALPAPDLHEFLDRYVAPRTPVEEMLAQIWALVLKVEQVGIHDNFFELGGHSLLATQLVSRIRNILKVELPLRELFAAPTVAELAHSIGQLQQQDLELTSPPILPRVKNAELPLSFAQTRLWFLDQFEPNSSFYNIPLALHLVGTLNKVALEQSLEEIIHRHEALRTNIITVDGQASQIIHLETAWTVSVVDLQHLSTSEQEIASQQLVQQQAIQPFDLAKQTLVRATLVVLSETEHILLVCMHHVVSDGWSIGVFVQELAALYNAYSQGKPSSLTPLPIQYADFALWQRNWLQGDVLQTQLNYWQEQLKDAPALLVLPTDRPRPAVQTFAGARQKFALSVELTQKLTKLSQEQGVTLFMTLLGAYDTLLYRYTEQSDILVGTPIANRNRSEIEGLIGFFINTLVLRTDISGDPSFNELLTRIRETALSAYSHQDLPFEMLVEALQPERDLSHTPLFQVMFVLENAPTSQLELTRLTVNPLPIENATSKFDLTLGMENTATGLVGAWEYNTDLFDDSTIARMTGHFVTLLEAIVANPQERISQLPMLTEVEQQQLFVEWNDTQADYPWDQCIHQLFERQVEYTPDAIAVIFDNQQLTYQQLNTQANQLAHYLQSLGVGPEVLVGIYLERSLSIIVGLLAVLKAGGAYVPLDPDYPQQRLADICQDSQISVLITQQKLLNSLPVEEVKVIVLDRESEILTNQSQENLVSGVEPENLACILYTSGSTGKPKGVMLTHAALVNHSSAISEVFGLTSSDRVLQFASFSFDVAAEEIFPTWYKGATVVIRPAQMFPDFTSFAQFIEQQKLSVLNITPAYWHEWAIAVSQSDATVPPSLRLVAVGGDAVLPETVTIWQQLVGDRVNCLNVYGPTEASVTAIVHDLLHPQSEKTNSVLIGRPIANTQAYILDRHLQPVPVGVRGELHISGVRLARGYLNRPELTEEKFIPNPFGDFGLPILDLGLGNRNENLESSQTTESENKSNNPKSKIQNPKLYKTGDLARYLPDGNIECFGRIDNQVKIRGFRIELGEIEAVLNQHINVQTSCAIVREDTPGDKYLVAYVVLHDEQITTISELRQFLSKNLPLYMVPQAFVILESLPLTPNRKVDRRALPAPDLYSDAYGRLRRDKYVAPRTPSEEMLAQIWAQVLKLEQVGIHDNFFEIGGHSLLATQLVSRIRNIFKVELPLRSLFAAATVGELAYLIGQLQQENLELTVPPILPRAKNAELPLSYSQQRLWFLDQLQPNSALYNIPLALHLVGNLNQAALEQSLEEIIDRHEALRTNFITIDGQPTQIIQARREQRIVSVVDLQHLPTSEQEIASQQLAITQAIQPFDLAKQALVRATLVVLSETEHILLVCMHHIVSDGWSIGVLVQELTTLYKAYAQGQPSNAAPLPIQYADFALWQRQWLQGEVLQSQLSYWQKQLANAPALLSLPTDRPRPAVQTFAGAHQKFALSLELTQKLTQLSQQQGVTLFMTLLAAYDTLLYRYTGQADILVGTPIANRNRSEIEGLIGFFVNTLVMRTDLSENPSFCELLTRVREMAVSAYAHQDLPFEMLVEALQPQRNLSHTPLFQVAFMIQNAPMSQVELTGLTISDLPIENVTAKFDLTLAMGNIDTGLVGVWEYNTNLFDAGTIERMVGHFVTMLESIVANPQQRISQLPILTEVEQQQLLIEWNDTQVDYAFDKCIHQLFEEQVQRTPDAVAVVFVDERSEVSRRVNQQLTYHELNCRANQLAHYLQSLGVGADVLVGICVERSLEMIVGLLAILKAGGAYVPLDPEYPQERLQYILDDALVSVLLTQKRVLDRLPSNQAQLVCLDEIWEKIVQNNQDNPTSRVTAFHLANLIYTSGSTGKPKGVMVEHTGLVNLAQAQIQTFNLDSDSRVLQFASFNFDASIWEIILALGSGAALYLGKKDSLLPGTPLIQLLRDHRITHITLPPSALAVLPTVELPALQTIIVGGEACSAELIKQWSVGRNFFNAYGPTEASVCTTIAKCTDSDRKISIGRPIANAQTYILDSHLQPVPVGVPGELHIGGAGLARGYFNRPELTQEKFIPNPFEDSTALASLRASAGGRRQIAFSVSPWEKAEGSRLYKTGDLVRYLPDGNIEYLGRIDNQVKIRGYRIELGEIEAVLSQLNEVREAVVVAREDQPNNKRLIAYVVPQQKNLESSSKKPENLSTDKVELWPSIAEYYVYDDFLYYAMTNDQRRNNSYKVAINQLVKDKIVVEIGTGKDAILSRFCVQGGAKKIYAIERSEETCRKARASIQKLGLADKITVIHGDATKVDLPELADVCVSEIVGAIGGSEGAAVIINNARRFLKPDGLMIPERSVTKMAVVTLPDEILHDPKFDEIPAYYTKEIFKQVGYPFDLRVCLRRFPQANVLSTVDVLEDLNFNESLSPEFSHEVKLEIQKPGRMDGFLVWLNLHTIAGEEIDILEHEYCWLPVYFPLFEPGIEVESGDVIQAVCSRKLCENNLNPDYAIQGSLLKKNGENINFEYVSYHYRNNFQETPFYQRLFASYGNAKNNYPNNLAQSLRANLKKLLPDYMIPSNFVVLENLPLTPNGKIDYRALPKPELTILNEADYVMPNTEAEKIIAGIWQTVLQVEKVGLYDNFFELGGHSLLATQVISRLQSAFGTSLPLRYIFESPTVAQLSEAILAQLEAGSRLAVPAILPVSTRLDIPLSWAQERLWFVNQLEGESGAYTIDFTLRLMGNLNVKALEQAFGEIVQRHEVLRTRFAIKDDKPVQIIAPHLSITLPVVDLQNVPDPTKQVEQLATVEVCKPFDLANGPVLRVKLWQVATDEYVLVFAIHHIAADGWSIGVLISELSAFYRAIATGSSAVLPELPIQYADFAVWQRQWLTNQVLERQLSYWKQQLKGAPPLLELPTDRPRPAVQTFRGGTERLKLDGLLTQQLKKLSQESGTTLFMTLLAGFVVLLSRYSGQTDLVVGSPIANRNRTEIEGLIGFFVNSLALRFDLSQEPTFEALLAQVRQVTQNAYDHQDLPFEMLVEELQLERNLDRNPLVQVVFALQNAPSSPWDLPDLKVEEMPSGLDSVRLDLEVYLWDTPEGLGGFCSYNRDLFDGATIARMMQNFVTLLGAIVDNPQQPVTLLPLLTQRDRHQLLLEWNDTQIDYPQNMCIHQLFEAQVERTPDAVAVVFVDERSEASRRVNEQLTYHELNCRANQLAHHLRSLGVGTDVLVGLCVERSLLTVIGLLGILKAGGAYVPLDPEYPQDRLSFMLEDTQVWVLLTQQRLVEKLPPNQANRVFLDEIWSEISQNSQDNLTGVASAFDLANVIYTSGSTGKPKGVMVEHSGLCNLAQAQIQAFGLQNSSRVLQFASFSFDACISEILMTLGSGAALYLGTKDSLMPGTPLIERLGDYGITHVTLPPSALAVLPVEKLPALQTLIVAGEACSVELMKQWSAGRNFFNAYGPTEASVCATIAKCTPDDQKISIGRPIDNTQIYILDSRLQPVPIGVPGELHIGGVGLARGYLNRPELTQEKFIPNPFSRSRGAEILPSPRLYKTGDKARYLSDGNIEYLGRIDNQVKVRGFRIELGEIEAVLSQHSLVQESVVVTRVDTSGDQTLVAYLVPGFKTQVLPQQLAQWQSEYVTDWQRLYEQAYDQPQAPTEDLTFNITGWNSSYTRQAIPDWEMREWVENTVSRILAVEPQRVLEIGCGTGLLLSRIAKNCKQYWGCDYSIAAIKHVEQVCSTVEGLEHVRLLHQMADNFTDIPQGEFDTVVINSVVQYFPSTEYLLQVLEGAIATISKKGRIFIGDVRSLPLLEPYHAAVQLSQASESRSIEQWQQQVHQSIAGEEELVIDPRFFIALKQRFPQISWVEIQPKRGHSQNELTQFRYDVILHLGADVQTTVVPWLNWQLDQLSFTQIQNQLVEEQPELLGIRRVPNQRVQQALQIWEWLENPPDVETVGQMRELLAQQPVTTINPEQFWELGQHLGYTVHLSWWSSSQDGSFDVVFCRNSSTPAHQTIAFWDNSAMPTAVNYATKSWTDYTNNPLHGKLVQKLVPQVREFIQQKLPSYMVPQAFVLLNALPLTPNGKVDRRALPMLDTASRNLSTGFVSPRTPVEAQLVQIWGEVLGLERIGVKDNFFELGGHSLLATQVISRINSALGFDLSVQKMFEFPTVAGIASYVEIMDWAAEDLAVTEVSDEIVEF
ncbi:amino acid adenylation domain-containing protein [Nostoc sp. C052]|uniref:non-ribosomal peptide synthase/polyketide synthase n=1 Tax=Nostoc sp. C052 TaxID=2576902 RepID=UPI0015C370C2|nr:non-ribosomal peptide synthase/polyketide synthase [Nostoc sp. C052]QLE40077.1 amino acid adenylation domain-containing protein [Nostoc sp. C052]